MRDSRPATGGGAGGESTRGPPSTYLERMDPRVEFLLRTLRLERQPEGGRYREWYRAPDLVTSADGI